MGMIACYMEADRDIIERLKAKSEKDIFLMKKESHLQTRSLSEIKKWIVGTNR